MTGSKDLLLGRIRNGESLSLGQQLKLSLLLSYPAILAQLSSVMMQYIDTSMGEFNVPEFLLHRLPVHQ